MTLSFQENFWEPDFNGITGYEILYNRSKEGNKMCQTYADFLRNRAKLDDEYGRNLMKLCNAIPSDDEIGTLKASWDAVKKETINASNFFCEMSRKMLEISEQTNIYKSKHKTQQKDVDDKMRSLQKEKKKAFDNNSNCKKMYETKCREFDKSKEMFEQNRDNPKEEEKQRKKMSNCKTAMENADSTYQNSIKSLEELRQAWEKEMENAAASFQKFDEERIKFLRNEMWTYTNLNSILSEKIDEKFEDCRKVLEKCNPVLDIQHFVNTMKTGQQRPAPIIYEAYNKPMNISGVISVERNPNLPSNMKAASLGRGIYSGPIPFKESDYLADSGNQSRGGNGKRPSASMETVTYNGRVYPRFVRAAFNYQAQGDMELNLFKGAVLEILRVEDDHWGIGKLDNRTGAFPLEFVEAVGS